MLKRGVENCLAVEHHEKASAGEPAPAAGLGRRFGGRPGGQAEGQRVGERRRREGEPGFEAAPAGDERGKGEG